MKKFTTDVLVIKVGTSTLTHKNKDSVECLDHASFRRLGQQITALQQRGYGIVLVSSAAITAGMAIDHATRRPSKTTHMPELQRLASIGWRHVLNAWSEAMPGKTIGEVLLTQHELHLASERDELMRVVQTLLGHGDIVVANENDTIAHEEIAFGDNDNLAATFAARIATSPLFSGQVHLVILSDVHGVYADKNDANTLIRHIDNLQEYHDVAGGAGSANGTGGMITKFAAARTATANGVTTWITHGRAENSIERAILGEIGTVFRAPTTKHMCRRTLVGDGQ